MTLLDKLQAHRGGLLQLKTQLYWYGRGGWDNNPGRVCLLLDTSAGIAGISAATRRAATAATADATDCADSDATLLLIDGQSHWVWITEEDVELLVNGAVRDIGERYLRCVNETR